MSYTILRGGRVIDGSGEAGFPADVLIDGGAIAGVGTFLPPADAAVVDCRGLMVAPGFIDLHSHSDLQVLAGRREKANQGVTSEVVGNCGFSPYPCGAHAGDLRDFANGILFGSGEWKFRGAREYLAATAEHSTLISVYSLIGHGSLRVALCGNRQGPLASGEIEGMEGVLDEALAGGACGFSTGLMYAPGSSGSAASWLSVERFTPRTCAVTRSA